MKTLLIVTIVLSVVAVIVNTLWVINGARIDRKDGNQWATIDRNLKAIGINLVVITIMVAVIVFAKVTR
jgi:hypothetical protein